MSGNQEDATKVKKSILMRYPVSFLEEVSRALIGYKSWRDNKQYYKALPILDTLIDYVTLDPETRKRVYELTEVERKNSRHYFIDIRKDLVEDFRSHYHGPRNDGLLPLKYLAPGKTLDAKRGIVIIRKPVNFLDVWGAYDPEHIIMVGGFYYKETRYNVTQYGMLPYEVIVPTIDFSDPRLKYHLTDVIPFSYWTALYDKGWEKISLICTMIEKVIAETLQASGQSTPNDGSSKVTARTDSAGGDDASRTDALRL